MDLWITLGLPAVALFVTAFAPALHWMRTEAAFFERTPWKHSTWKTLWIVGLFTGALPIVGMLWWYRVAQTEPHPGGRL